MKVISVRFFRLGNSSEPVKSWLLSLSRQDRLIIGQDLKTSEYGWPLGMPIVRKLDVQLWEARSILSSRRISRVLFTVAEGEMVLLHGFIKKAQKIPINDFRLACKRRDLVQKSK